MFLNVPSQLAFPESYFFFMQMLNVFCFSEVSNLSAVIECCLLCINVLLVYFHQVPSFSNSCSFTETKYCTNNNYKKKTQSQKKVQSFDGWLVVEHAGMEWNL